jgi:hypothetical protein
MKKLSLVLFAGLLAAACNNSAEDDKKKDSVNVDVNTKTATDPVGDTSSYDRMPNKLTDSTPK